MTFVFWPATELPTTKKFLLRSESSRDYIDGLLSMEHLPNTTVIDMAHIVANHALVSRKEEVNCR